MCLLMRKKWEIEFMATVLGHIIYQGHHQLIPSIVEEERVRWTLIASWAGGYRQSRAQQTDAVVRSRSLSIIWQEATEAHPWQRLDGGVGGRGSISVGKTRIMKMIIMIIWAENEAGRKDGFESLCQDLFAKLLWSPSTNEDETRRSEAKQEKASFMAGGILLHILCCLWHCAYVRSLRMICYSTSCDDG